MGSPLKRGYTFLLGHTIKFNIPESKPLFENGLAAEAGLKFLLRLQKGSRDLKMSWPLGRGYFFCICKPSDLTFEKVSRD